MTRLQMRRDLPWSGPSPIGPSLSGVHAIAAGYMPLGRDLLRAINRELPSAMRLRSLDELLSGLGIDPADTYSGRQGLVEWHHFRDRRRRVRLVPYIHVDAAVAFLLAETQTP